MADILRKRHATNFESQNLKRVNLMLCLCHTRWDQNGHITRLSVAGQPKEDEEHVHLGSQFISVLLNIKRLCGTKSLEEATSLRSVDFASGCR